MCSLLFLTLVVRSTLLRDAGLVTYATRDKRAELDTHAPTHKPAGLPVSVSRGRLETPLDLLGHEHLEK